MMFQGVYNKRKTTLPAIIKFLKLTHYYKNPIGIRLESYSAEDRLLERYANFEN